MDGFVGEVAAIAEIAGRRLDPTEESRHVSRQRVANVVDGESVHRHEAPLRAQPTLKRFTLARSACDIVASSDTVVVVPVAPLCASFAMFEMRSIVWTMRPVLFACSFAIVE